MSKHICISHSEWNKVLEQISQDYPRSITLIRYRMKELLGFTPREHRSYDAEKQIYKWEVHLDFYDEKKRTYFLLKYGDFFNRDLLQNQN